VGKSCGMEAWSPFLGWRCPPADLMNLEDCFTTETSPDYAMQVASVKTGIFESYKRCTKKDEKESLVRESRSKEKKIALAYIRIKANIISINDPYAIN
jgi:hypothetical protein